jgi:hypothetical protein
VTRRSAKVIFIAGMGRSGSTLLDRLLGAVEGVCSVGELRWIWSLGFRDNQLCGCGERFLNCPFWTAVVREALGDPGGLDHAGMHRRQENLLRLKWLPFLAVGRLPTARLRRDLDEFHDTHRRLYAAIRAVSGATTVVDSSKYPPYGVALRGMDDVDLSTVHLVRDSRATAYSVSRQRDPSREGRAAYGYERGAATVALNWLTVNAATELAWARRHGYLRIRYEDLALHAAAVADRVLRQAGIGAPAPAELGPNTFDLGTQHTLAGNPMRMHHGATVVHPDLAWHKGLPRRARLAATLISWPGLLRYGYL